MLKPQEIRVAGAALWGGQVVRADLTTDGHRIRDLGEAAVQGVSHDTGDALETAHAHALAGSGAELFGIAGGTTAQDLPITGDVLAAALGAPVIWDFCASIHDIGGASETLDAVYLFALARFLGLDHPVLFVEPGAAIQLIYVDPSQDRPEGQGALVAFAAGPGMAAGDEPCFDAAPSERHIAQFLHHSFFDRPPPKQMRPGELSLPNADGATRLACVAAAVGRALDHLPQVPARVILLNPADGPAIWRADLADMLGIACDAPVSLIETMDDRLAGGAVAAQSMGFLAARVALGLPTVFPSTTGLAAPISGGHISYPDALAGD